METKIIKSVGTIVKKEKLATVVSDPQNKILCLESLLPYPGYHGTTIPDNLEPESLFIVTKVRYSDETIIRAIQKVKKIAEISFDAAPGTVMLQNNPVNIIRFKDLGYNNIKDICNLFNKQGIEFEKSRNIPEYEDIIQIRKYFRMEKIEDGIYADTDVSKYFYLEVPTLINWVEFEELTKSIKYNIKDLNFDAAQTSVYDENGLIDFVRIYDNDKDIEKLKSIRKSYLTAYEKM